MTNDIDAIYQNTIDGIRDNARINDLTPAENWSRAYPWQAIACYNPDLDIESLTVGQIASLERRVTEFLTPAEPTITAAGYIVYDHNGTIYGVGQTAAEADADMRSTLVKANIQLLAPDANSADCLGSFTREDCMTTVAATQGLLDLIESKGGSCGWGTTWEGIACTLDEINAV
jgi:hypothetical protein